MSEIPEFLLPTPLAEFIVRPRKRLSLVAHAREAVERAKSIESLHTKSYGGHRHTGANHPMLELPLPRGWRKP